MGYDPKYYVVAQNDGYAVLPFGEISVSQLEAAEMISADDVLVRVQDCDISLVHDRQEWVVQWMHGVDLTHEMLAEIH